jgi:nucleoside phosphorylase
MCETNSKSAPTVVLLTVNEHETSAVLDAFLGVGRIPAHTTRAGITYNELGNHGGMRIVHTICEMGAGGIGAAQQRTRAAADAWRPVAVVAVGIAFGMDESKQKIGDVLVATQLQDYELGRVGSNGNITPRGDKPGTSDPLRNRLRHADANQRRASADWPKVHFGLVLSGQKLVDNLDYREALKALYSGAIGGEMEGVGLYVSATEAKVDWIVIKGLCDWGHNKNNPEKETWQKLAAHNAARVLKSALDLGNLYSSDPINSKSEKGSAS